MTLLGYFDTPDAPPAFDPGLSVGCIVCFRPLTEQPRVTVSLMGVGSSRSWFFRAHKSCWEALPPDEQARYEESVIANEEAANYAP